MASKIEWLQMPGYRPETLNPIRVKFYDGVSSYPRGGTHCEKISAGCRNCWAERQNKRMLPGGGTGLAYDRASRDKVHVILDQKKLEKPLRWQMPRAIFWGSMTDLLGRWIRIDMFRKCCNVMAETPRHRHLLLTKRPIVMSYPRHLWYGVSIENQDVVARRIGMLLESKVAVRFISYEPALGPVNWDELLVTGRIGWLICGGESGPGARPMHPEWARAAREACRKYSVPFLFKQWGEYVTESRYMQHTGCRLIPIRMLSHPHKGYVRVGKKWAGRLLDGREWNEFPEPTPAHAAGGD